MKRNDPILHELVLRNEATGLERRFMVEHDIKQEPLSVRLGDGVYWVAGVKHVRIVDGRIVDAE